jgi:hypothetical protein
MIGRMNLMGQMSRTMDHCSQMRGTQESAGPGKPNEAPAKGA